MKEGNEVRSMMRQPTSNIEEEKKNQQEQLTYSTIFLAIKIIT